MAVSLEQRTANLQWQIRNYVGQGYRVVSQTPTTAQLVVRKRIGLVEMVVWTVVIGMSAGLALAIFLPYYWNRRDSGIYLEVDSEGTIIEYPFG